MSILISTTGTVNSVTIGDLGGRVFLHPETNNYELSEEYTYDEISGSTDLGVALNAGYIKLTNNVGVDIANSLELANVQAIKSSENIGTITTNDYVNKSYLSVLLAAKNNNRCCIWVINESKKDLYINIDNPATDKFIKIKKDAQEKIEGIKGAIYGIWKPGADKGALIIETSFE